MANCAQLPLLRKLISKLLKDQKLRRERHFCFLTERN